MENHELASISLSFVVRFSDGTPDIQERVRFLAGDRRTILSQPGENVVGHDKLVTPTGAFVEMPLGHAEIVIAGAQGTSLIMP